MTAVQKARLAGFNASLAQRGVLLSLQDSTLTFDALVQPVGPDNAEYSISDETRNASKIHILRDTSGISQLGVGSILNDAAAAVAHRVTRIEDHPTNIAVIFHCETSLSA